MSTFALQSPLHGFHGFVDEGKKPMIIIATISASDQMVVGSKNIESKLDFNELIKAIKIIYPFGCN